jgi:hypothetical protein
MGLTGGGFLVFVTLLAIVVVVVAVRYLGKFPERSLKHIAARAGLVVSTQVAVLFAVLVAVNSWGDFYASWGDLLGSDHSRAQVQQHPKPSASSLNSVKVDKSRLRTADGKGRIDIWSLHGPRSGLNATVYVVVPPQYLIDKTRVFPAIEVLSSDPQKLATKINTDVFPAIYVIVTPPAPSACVDNPTGVQGEAFVTQDVPEAMTFNPPIGTNGQATETPHPTNEGYRLSPMWGVIGDSAHGYCTAKMVLDRSDKFVAAVSLGDSYATPNGNYYGQSVAYKNQNTLLWQLKNAQTQPPGNMLLLTNGDAEALAGAAQEPMHISLLPQGTTLDGSLPDLQKWLRSKLTMANNASSSTSGGSPSPSGDPSSDPASAPPGGVPTPGNGPKGPGR